MDFDSILRAATLSEAFVSLLDDKWIQYYQFLVGGFCFVLQVPVLILCKTPVC